MIDLYDSQNFDPKTRAAIWMSTDVVPVEYGALSHMSHLIMQLFQSVSETTFMWNDVLWPIVSLFVWIVLSTQLRLYRIPIDPVK